MKRSVFFISDGTGITAEILGHSLITQFDNIEFVTATLPYIDTIEKAQDAVLQINQSYSKDQIYPLVFGTLVSPYIRHIVETSEALFLDFFSAFIEPLEIELQTQSSHTIGRTHSVLNDKNYQARIEAINFSVLTDDGVNFHQYQQANLVLLGVSRCGKTPTSLYLALQYGVRAANYPLTEEDIESDELPKSLQPFRQKLFGLTIDAKRLQAIRSERRPNSRYASLAQCQLELRHAEGLFHKLNIPYLNTTTLSIEEISTKVLAQMGIPRNIA